MAPSRPSGLGEATTVSPDAAPIASPVVGLREKIARAAALLLTLMGLTSLLVVALVEVQLSKADTRAFEGSMREALLARGRSLAASHAGVFRALVRDLALTEMQTTVTDAVQTQGVLYGVFIDSQGRVLAYCSPTRPCEAHAAPGATQLNQRSAVGRDLGVAQLETVAAPSTREATAFATPVIEFAHPVSFEGQNAGTLRYGLSVRPLERSLGEMRLRRAAGLRSALLTIGLVVGAMLILGVIYARRMAHLITEPLRRLTQASSRLAAGERTVRVDIRSGDELQVLGESFNAMTGQLEVSYSALERSNRSLQQEIEDRKQAQRERGELQERLFQSQKMEAVGQLAGGVAHDFNNILAIILGSAELEKMALDEGDLSEAHQLNGAIMGAAERAANLTRQLLTFARKETTDPRIISINETITSFERLIRRVLEEGVTLKVELEEGLPPVLIDPGRAEQVLMNLCVNARDAMNGSGTLVLRTKQQTLSEVTHFTSGSALPGSYVVLEAEDNGSGIESEVLSRIFEPFFTTKAAGEGTGLGLATVHGIVTDAAGFIDVESEPNHGTCFRVYLPAQVGEGSQEVKQVTSRSRLRAQGPVLVCEDDDGVRKLITNLLQRAGYDVAATGLPDQALRLVEEREFSLLISDVVMPGSNGVQLANAVRRIRPTIPILFVSGYTDGILESYGIRGDSPHFLRKPFSGAELLSCLERLASEVRQEP